MNPLAVALGLVVAAVLAGVVGVLMTWRQPKKWLAGYMGGLSAGFASAAITVLVVGWLS